MELRAGEIARGLAELGGGVLQEILPGGGDRHLLGREERALQLAMPPLDPRHGGVAADGPGVEVALDLLEPRAAAAQLAEVTLGSRVPDGRVAPRAHQLGQVLEVPSGGAAAVVADPPGHQAAGPVGVGLDPLLDLAPGPAGRRVVVRGGQGRRDPRAVEAHPGEGVVRQRAVLTGRAAEDVGVVAALRQDLDQAARVPEGIEVGAGLDVHAELLAEPALAQQDLPDEGLAAGHVAVGLQPPASGDVPAAGPHQLADALEERRLVLLHPAIQDGLVVAEDEAVEALAELRRAAEGGQGLGGPLLPLPQPDGIDVRIAEEVHAGLLHVRSP